MADESLSLAYSGGSDDNENEVGAGAVQPWDSVDKETDERSHLPHYGLHSMESRETQVVDLRYSERATHECGSVDK